MRKHRLDNAQIEFSMLTVDDDATMTATLQSYFTGRGYQVDTENDPLTAIDRVRNGNYDILLLDFLMTPICGDQVVEQIRSFNQDIFIILLTGHKSMAPPIKTVRELDIQGYYEKSDRFDQLELLVESCVKSIRQMRTIRAYQKSTADLVDAMPQIYNIQDMEQITANILQTAAHLFHSSRGLLALKTEDGSTDKLSLGQPIPEFSGTNLPELLDQVTKATADLDNCRLMAPIFSETRETAGLLVLDTEKPPTLHQIQLFRLYVRQSSAALGNTSLLQKIKKSYVEMTQTIRRMVDAKDIYTRGHSDRVAYYARLLAEKAGKDEHDCERVYTAGLFHDIGKLGIPDEILLADRSLSTAEFSVIQGHPANGAEILSAISFFGPIASIIRSHHERIDGKGYPDGLVGDEIPEEARIISIADAFDAMTSTRRYRNGLTFEDAVQRLRECSGTQFDANLTALFLSILEDWPRIQEEIKVFDHL